MTPEGQHLVLHAMAMHSIDVPLGGPVLAIIMALGYTVLLCFTLFKTGSLSKAVFNAH